MLVLSMGETSCARDAGRMVNDRRSGSVPAMRRGFGRFDENQKRRKIGDDLPSNLIGIN
jgi:hypothetical protein